jgi:hypothetical protein
MGTWARDVELQATTDLVDYVALMVGCSKGEAAAWVREVEDNGVPQAKRRRRGSR